MDERTYKEAENQRSGSGVDIAAEAQRIMADEKTLLDFLSGVLNDAKLPPFSEERKRAILSHPDRTAEVAAAQAAMASHEALFGAVEKYSLPKDKLGNMERAARLFLKTPEQPDADEYNRAFVDSLKTPEGRRSLFYRVLDYLEQEGEAAFLEQDRSRICDNMREKPTYANLGFVVDALRGYVMGNEGTDLPPEIHEMLDERKRLCENGGDAGTLLGFMTCAQYPLLNEMTQEELLNLVACCGLPKTPLENAVLQQMLPDFSNAMAAMDFRQEKPDYVVGRALGERGLLNGDMIFRDGAEQRMTHANALKAIAAGEPVTLEHYESRQAGEGRKYRCRLENGQLALSEGEECRRDAMPDLPYNEAVIRAAAILNKKADGRILVVSDETGRTLKQSQAQTMLAEGAAVYVSTYQADMPYLGKRESLRMEPEAEAGCVTGEPAVCSRAADLSSRPATHGASLAELIKIRQVLKESDPFYVLNSPEFGKLTTALDKVVRCHQKLGQGERAPSDKLKALYADLNAKTDAYLRMKAEKMKLRKDGDPRGHLRYDVVSSLKTIIQPERVNAVAASFQAEIARQPQAAPQQKQRAPEAPGLSRK